jgi:hypothetical protein
LLWLYSLEEVDILPQDVVDELTDLDPLGPGLLGEVGEDVFVEIDGEVELRVSPIELTRSPFEKSYSIFIGSSRIASALFS